MGDGREVACGKQVFHSFLSRCRLDDIVQNVYVIIVNVAIIEQKGERRNVLINESAEGHRKGGEVKVKRAMKWQV